MQSASISAARPETLLTVPQNGQEHLILTVTPKTNGADSDLTLQIYSADGKQLLQTISLYPPGQRGRFAIILPKETEKILVRGKTQDNAKMMEAKLEIAWQQ